MSSPIAPRLLAAGLALTLSACGSTAAPSTEAPPAVPSEAASVVPATPDPSAAVTPSPAPATFPPIQVGALPAIGPMYFGDEKGEIRSIDLETGKTTLIVGGKPMDEGPWFSPDGARFMFFRKDDESLRMADADGSHVTKVGPAADLADWNWSPSGDRIAALPDGGGDQLVLLDPASGDRQSLKLAYKANDVQWLTDDQLMVISEVNGSASTAWTINADGSGQVELDLPSLCCGVGALPGSGVFAWVSWNGTAQGRIHLHDTATGTDILLASTDLAPNAIFTDPRISPDGRWLAALNLTAQIDGVQLVLLAADGSGAPMPVGPAFPRADALIDALFSPDGSQLMVAFDGSAAVVALPDVTVRTIDWPWAPGRTWRPLPAPPAAP
jgi:dipeptidyl aminopeptidase/acylaminoacyl peptidase